MRSYPIQTTLRPLFISCLAATACGGEPSVETADPQGVSDSTSGDFDGAPGDDSSSSSGPTSGSSTSSGGGASETCGNGLDDDGNGSADEGCACAEGEEQACFVGAISKAGVGVCVMGKQACEGAGESSEFTNGTWGACVGSGQPLTCAQDACGQIDDSCGGTLDCGKCDACVPGVALFEEPGMFNFTVPAFKSMTVEVWGAGGGGSAYGAKVPASSGNSSDFGGKLSAGGGTGGLAGGGNAAGGTATGGTTNTSGGAGEGACDGGYPMVCSAASGGDAPNGGQGGTGPKSIDACAGGDGQDGAAPGGGGAGAWACLGPWWMGYGWAYGGGGAGAGAYAKKVFEPVELTAGTKLGVSVGAPGSGAKGVMTEGQPGMGKNAGYYTGGEGAPGRVAISWTCP